MSWAVRAWRDADGNAGITIGTVTAAGYENHVAEFDLDEHETGAFLDQCATAMQRAKAAPSILREPLPGAYESWEAAGHTACPLCPADGNPCVCRCHFAPGSAGAEHTEG